MKESHLKYVKTGAMVLSLVGIVITPEQQQAIAVTFGVIYTIVSFIQGKIKARNE